MCRALTFGVSFALCGVMTLQAFFGDHAVPSESLMFQLGVFPVTFFAGVVRLVPYILGEVISGNAPSLSFQRVESLGAALLLRSTPSYPEAALPGTFTDAFFNSTHDDVTLHAVVTELRGRDDRQLDKRPIVFVHGFPEMWYTWRAQMQHFERLGHPVLAVSLRGYALSEHPDSMGKYTMPGLIGDVRAAIEFMSRRYPQAGKPLLVAHDWGAGISWAFVRRYPDEVVAYVPISVAPTEASSANMDAKQLYMFGYMIFFQMMAVPELVLTAGNGWFTALAESESAGPRGPRSEDDIAVFRQNIMQPGTAFAAVSFYRGMIGRDTLAMSTPSEKYRLPVRILRGEDDSALGPGLFVNLERWLDDFTVTHFQRCSHWVMWEAEDKVNLAIEGVLGEFPN